MPFIQRLSSRLKYAGPIALLFLATLFLSTSIRSRGIFEYIGIDYRLWFATGQIALRDGFSAIYSPELQAQYQLPLYEAFSKPGPLRIPFWPLPLPYLSAFTVPFLALPLLPPQTGLIIWESINIAGTIAYLWTLGKRSHILLRGRDLFLIFLSLPLFLNLIFAQVNLWLLIAFGEALLAFYQRKEFLAGFWLGGLLLKPQTLIIAIPYLLLKKKAKAITGFMVSAVSIFILSLILSGSMALLGPLGVISKWPMLLAGSGMGWGSLLTNASRILPMPLAWGIIFVGYVATLAIGWQLWKADLDTGNPTEANILFLGTYAATCSISWHSNIHMALPLLIPGILLWAEGKLPSTIACLWLFLPTSLFMTLALVLDPGVAHDIAGIAMLGVNTVVLLWTSKQSYL